MYTLKIVSDMINICLSDFLPINQFNGPNIIMENYLMGMVDIKFFLHFLEFKEFSGHMILNMPNKGYWMKGMLRVSLEAKPIIDSNS